MGTRLAAAVSKKTGGGGGGGVLGVCGRQSGGGGMKVKIPKVNTLIQKWNAKFQKNTKRKQYLKSVQNALCKLLISQKVPNVTFFKVPEM